MPFSATDKAKNPFLHVVEPILDSNATDTQRVLAYVMVGDIAGQDVATDGKPTPITSAAELIGRALSGYGIERSVVDLVATRYDEYKTKQASVGLGKK